MLSREEVLEKLALHRQLLAKVKHEGRTAGRPVTISLSGSEEITVMPLDELESLITAKIQSLEARLETTQEES